MKLFSTPKRAVITVFCIVAGLAILIAAITAIVIHTAFVSKAHAKTIALADVGLSETDVSGLRARLEHDDGRFVYEVDFYCNGTEYDYTIEAASGDIIGRDIDPVSGMSPTQTTASAETAAPDPTGSESAADATQSASATAAPNADTPSITIQQAKDAALADAGLREGDVTFLEVRSDRDDGMELYEISFYTATAEYDYEVYAADGSIKEKSIETFDVSGGSANSTAGITAERAQEIALEHAGLNAVDVTFTEIKLERDDGIMQYEISFYAGTTEYDYRIHAETGAILESDREEHHP